MCKNYYNKSIDIKYVKIRDTQKKKSWKFSLKILEMLFF